MPARPASAATSEAAKSLEPEKKKAASPFSRAFTKALLIQVGLLAIVAALFFAGGPEANPVRYMIAIFGMALMALIGMLGVRSLAGMVAVEGAAMLLIAYIVASIATTMGNKK